MLAHPTHERLIALGLPGMAKAFEDQRRSPDIAALSFEERIGLMVDREAAERDTKRSVHAPQVRRAAAERRRRGRRPANPARHRPRPVPKARRRRLDRPRRRAFDHGADRRRQKLDRLRARPQGLPGWEKRPLPSGPAPVRGVGARAWRWPLREAAQNPRTRPAPDSGRLGALDPNPGRTARSP